MRSAVKRGRGRERREQEKEEEKRPRTAHTAHRAPLATTRVAMRHAMRKFLSSTTVLSSLQFQNQNTQVLCSFCVGHVGRRVISGEPRPGQQPLHENSQVAGCRVDWLTLTLKLFQISARETRLHGRPPRTHLNLKLSLLFLNNQNQHTPFPPFTSLFSRSRRCCGASERPPRAAR